MKKIILFLLFSIIYAQQIGYVSVEHNIYNFLQRMSAEKIIDNYNSFELPKSRNKIAAYLKIIYLQKNKLSKIDQQKLKDFLNEFELDVFNSTDKYFKTLNSVSSKNYFEGEKFFYFKNDNKGNSIFINLLGQAESLFSNNGNDSKNANLFVFGGILRGTINGKIGYYIKATNGKFFGNKSLAQEQSYLKYNYKFNRNSQYQTATDYFDQTEGYITYQDKSFQLKLGRDRTHIGYGINKNILGANYPPMDYLALSFHYDFFNYKFLFGKLMGVISKNYISLPKTNMIDKFFVYHKFGINFSKQFYFSFGEIVIYSSRTIDFSYLNPFNFFKSAEHLNQDRDNSLLFLSLENTTFKHFKFYATLLIDDIDFSKIGTGWYGNKTAFDIGLYSSILYKLLPLDFELQYLRTEPYVYTHHIFGNNYSSLNYSLIDPIQPNSSIFNFRLNYFPHHRFNISINFSNSVWGRNIYDVEGNLVKNYGGGFLDGHTTTDSDKVSFLDGNRLFTTDITAKLKYEFLKNYFLEVIGKYRIEQNNSFVEKEFFFSSLNLRVRI